MIKTTVKAHTGSTKFRTYKVVTGTLVEYVRRELGPNHYTIDVVIIDAEGVTYVTSNGRVIETTHTVVADSEPEAEQAEQPEAEQAPEPEPRTIRFESVTCYRCEGERRNPAWGKVGGGWCFQCGGVGTLRTQAGKEAEAAYERLRDERLGARYGDIAIGEAYKRNGEWFEKTGKALIHADYPVHRHHGATTRQIWREIAAQYKGATLVY